MSPLIGLVIAGSALVSPLTPTPALADFISNTATQQIVASSTADNLGTEISQVAEKYRIERAVLNNLVQSESEGNPNAIGDHGCSYGLVQINICAHPGVEKAGALDPIFALNYAAKAISAGTEDIWTSCNCYSFVSNFVKLPRMADITVNTNVPHKGEVAIFWYHDRETGLLVKHVAFVKSVAGGVITLAESNKTRCLVDVRVTNTSDPYLSGFWDPNAV